MKIEIGNIKGYFPDGYTEQKYINSNKFRIKADGQDTIIFNTPEKHQEKDDTQFKNRKVQTVFFNKYVLSFIITESTNIDLLFVAKTVTITMDNGEIHKAELIDTPTYEPVQETDFKKVTIRYRDLDSKVTVNHLQADNLTDGIASFSSGLTTVYTPLYCKKDVSEYERDENSDIGISLVSKDVAFRVIKFYAYITENQLETIKRGMSAAYLSEMKVVFDGTTYTALEVPEIEELEDEFEGIKGILVTLKYELLINYSFTETDLIEITISVDPSTMQFEWEDSTILTSLVTTNSPNGWNVLSVSDTWINAYKIGDNLNVTVGTSTEDRSGTVTIASVDDATKTATITVQQSQTDITANPTVQNFNLIDGTIKTSVISTDAISGWKVLSQPDWVTTLVNGNNLGISVSNTTTARTGQVVVSITDDESKTAVIYIYQGIAI